MDSNNSIFNTQEALRELKNYLPSQAPLKDFVHHNTLHAFQNHKFYDGVRKASKLFGYSVFLQLDDYRALYISKRIRENVLKRIIAEKMGTEHVNEWMKKVISKKYDTAISPRIGLLRAVWEEKYHVNLDLFVHPYLFRILCSYLDQGISIWSFPVGHEGFLSCIREIEKNSFTSFFSGKRAKELLLKGNCKIENLLKIIVGDETLYKQYLFDQQFAHPGWSGMVSTVENHPQSLLNPKKISIHDLIVLELLLEIDTLDIQLGKNWLPIDRKLDSRPDNLFDEVTKTELDEVLSIWQDAFEWSYYDQVLAAIQLQDKCDQPPPSHKSFQVITCIDDRALSFRRYLERIDPECETFATPGFFGVEFFFQPEHGKFYAKCCPAPVTPKYLIRETETKRKRTKEAYFSKLSHSLFLGWLITQTLGLLSGFKLALNIFRPSAMPAMASPNAHMDNISNLTIENKSLNHRENDLQIGFTVEEMVQRVETILVSIGLVKDFASIIYVVGHGATSINNPHYCAYDCGACGGKPGSVNAKVFCFMANHLEVRAKLCSRGLVIPVESQFLACLHDTTRDEITYFDEHLLSPVNSTNHKKNKPVYERALDFNAKERSRRLVSIDTTLSAEKIHKEILRRSVSLFEPRQELNHSTNAICFVGRRELSKNIYLDRRSAMNSYDYQLDLDGKYLVNVMKPIAPVMGGINLEYYFSRVDNYKLGAGTKLPHNVMGLIGVANGSDGDLRSGLPSQMIEVHDPVRLLVIVEQFPEIVLEAIKFQPETYEFYVNEWVRLVAVNPETREIFLFKDEGFSIYRPLTRTLESISDVISLIESVKAAESTHIAEATKENLPVYLMH